MQVGSLCSAGVKGHLRTHTGISSCSLLTAVHDRRTVGGWICLGSEFSVVAAIINFVLRLEVRQPPQHLHLR